MVSSEEDSATTRSIDEISTEEAGKVIAGLAKPVIPDEKSWKNQNNVIQEFTISGGSNWSKLTVAERKATGQRYLRLRRYNQRFSIRTPEQLAALMQTLQDGANSLGWERGIESEHKKFMDTISSLKTLRARDLEKIQEMSRLISKLRQEHLKLQLPEYKEDIKTFKTLLGTAQKEQELQSFLQAHTWFFGLEYLDQQPIDFAQFKLSDSKYDFLLQRYDTFYDIFELKLPSAQLFRSKLSNENDMNTPTRESPISSTLNEAISQMIGYLELATIYSNVLFREKNILLHKPKGFIVIGRTKKKELKAKTTLNYYLSHLEVMTYDDLLGRAENLVKMIEKRKVSS